MLILAIHAVGAVAATWFFGWRSGLEVLGGYGCCLIGARSPQHFIGSQHALERAASQALAKVRELAQKGKR